MYDILLNLSPLVWYI